MGWQPLEYGYQGALGLQIKQEPIQASHGKFQRGTWASSFPRCGTWLLEWQRSSERSVSLLMLLQTWGAKADQRSCYDLWCAMCCVRPSVFIRSLISCINLFREYLLSNCYVPLYATIPGPGHMGMNQTKSLPSWSLHSSGRDQATTRITV